MLKRENYIPTDINECSLGLASCSTNALCINSKGSFICACYDGYSGNGTVCNGMFFFRLVLRVVILFGCYLYCNRNLTIIYSADIDECSLGSDNCSTKTQCTDTNGGFICMCNDGYSGTGVICNGRSIIFM